MRTQPACTCSLARKKLAATQLHHRARALAWVIWVPIVHQDGTGGGGEHREVAGQADGG